ncbi:MAG: hypothetical protein Q4E91_04880 [Lachnospiraceae bacterium]|nr:hypothetical protein [Lachnospiraceae bacterium]
MKSKKSRFWNFWLAFLPGCSEMYMGFMKMGLSLMGMFWGTVAVASLLEMGPLVFAAMIVWFYSFFHARNLVHLPDTEFQHLEDEFLVDLSVLKGYDRYSGGSKILAVVLIVFGGYLCLRSVMNLLWYIVPSFIMNLISEIGSFIPRMIIGLGIIALGIWMIRGKKEELLEDYDFRSRETQRSQEYWENEESNSRKESEDSETSKGGEP